ncbi:hypothetical protein GCM10023185_06250 [Hymenobacter saemangeumensis]|uniref:Uncharacterized protein n=2 Tax=Hymenobacter saemangeumensis TaxID=1084522 RepID=A0ABP8I225_9BACT
MDFVYLKDHNRFVYKSKVNARADTQVFLTTHFAVDLPKGLKHWQVLGNEFVFEYEKKQLVYIQMAYQNESQPIEPTLRNVNNEEVYARLSPYWYERKYPEKILKENHPGRISKVYSDGRAVILLYNVKQENVDHFLRLTNGLTYLN